jgi:hypothetical protein
VLLLLGRLVAAVADPVMGVITEWTNTRWGKSRPWILWAAIPFGIFQQLVDFIADCAMFAHQGRCDLRIKWNKYHSIGFLATDLLNIKRCANKKIFLEDFLQNRLIGYIWSFQECFSFSRLLTSSIVPLNGPGVSILIDTRAAANFNDSGTS